MTKKSILALYYRALRWLLVTTACLSCGLIPCNGAIFSNTVAISFPAGAPVTPYPSTISVSGLTGRVVGLSVTLLNLSHPAPDDIDVLLVGPGGQAVLMMSDAGGSNAVSAVNLTFSDGSGVSLPDSTRITSGTYEPSNYGSGDVFPRAPAGPYSTSFSTFNGTDPNGSWRLFVYRDTGSAIGSIAGGWRLNISLADPPVIVTHPQSQAVSPGATVTFGVGVSGTPPFGFQWLRNGQILVPFGVGTASLTISNVQAANAGTYAVVVTNSANPVGVTSSNAVLNVTGPLTLVQPPRSQTVDAGDTVMLQVTAAGTPPLHYQWQLNGIVLADETNSTLTLSNAQAINGGAFNVVVFNDSDVIETEPAVLVIRAATELPPVDDFDRRPILESPQGVVQGNSARAGSEPGEPVIPGGGQTVWYEWLAPDTGIVTLTARGSAFDTLLGVFTGNVVSNLTLIAKDDDQGGFYTSSLQFNAKRGTRYQIMLDGFDYSGIGGEFTLGWQLEVTDEVVPVILEFPQTVGVHQGSNATFRVLNAPTGEGREEIIYQWFFNGAAIRSATSNVFTVMQATSADIGFYSVLLRNGLGRSVKSPSVDLQLTSVSLFDSPGSSGFPFVDKLQDLQNAGANRPSIGFISIGLGVTDQVIAKVTNSGAVLTPCNTAYSSKYRYHGLEATNNGVIRVDTIGSQVYARMAVYRDPISSHPNPLACDTNSGPSLQPARFLFNGTNTHKYVIVVEALQITGDITLTSKMGIAPPIAAAPKYCLIAEGGTLLLEMPATNWCPLPACQWQLNGQPILNATNASLVVTQAGAYSVVMSNFVSAATNVIAYVDLAGPFLLQYALQTNNPNVNFLITASNAAPFILQTTTNLGDAWVSLATNPNPCVPLIFTNLLTGPRRFFRAAPWFPPGP
ncbi:MAG TPA: immunoglobulin domain-containing protein [Candidatus Binatia bacterium]|nr:immunoglobulin domain-containing protein [Candidatus Binatia bacterium]